MIFSGDLVSVSYETKNGGDPDQIEGNGTKNNKKKEKNAGCRTTSHEQLVLVQTTTDNQECLVCV